MANLLEKLSFSNDIDVSPLVAYINETPADDLFHIDLVSLSRDLGFELNALIDIFVYGVKNGAFIMEWEYHCPHCGGIAKESASLHEAEHENHCPACRVDFVNSLDDNVEVFFSIHPSVKRVSERAREAFASNMTESIQSSMKFEWKKAGTISGIRIIQNNFFREIMGEEVLSPDQSLEIMRTSILFTDIKGSTEMYTRLGDAVAFKLVRDHFRILFRLIKKHDGVPVKTIGDAVMGVFTDERNALSAALEIQKSIVDYSANQRDDEKIILKIGVHSGSAIIVTLNGRLDYFGNSVNTSARIQAQARPGEVVISDALFRSGENRKTIARYVKRVYRNKIALKGLKNEMDLYHIGFLDPPSASPSS